MTRSTMSEPMTPSDPASPARTLDALRVDIDRIDAAIHGLLMERAAIIDRLIAVKARQGGGSAFRPGREAQMMRRLVQRHSGILPLDTVEGIWRIIISTFTYVQAPYSVHADGAMDDPAMRDSGRFHFGFTVPLVGHAGARAVIAAVAGAAGDLGLVRAEAPEQGAWWTDLMAPDAPKIIARLPFVERAGHAAALPLYVVAKPLAEAAAGDIAIHAVADASAPGDAAAAEVLSVEVLARAEGSLIAATPGGWTLGAVADAFRCAPAAVTWIGSHARRFEIEERIEIEDKARGPGTGT
jgi:chorismate mutase